MRPIRIAARYRPFSHQPGTSLLIPGGSIEATVYPTRVVLKGLGKPFSKTIDFLNFTGPVRGFTVMQDLEGCFVKVFGEMASGHFRYLLKHEGSYLKLIADRHPLEMVIEERKEKLAPKAMKIFHLPENARAPAAFEKISLGSHKDQDIDLMRRRCDLKELLPIWFRLAQLVPPQAASHLLQGNFKLLNACEEKIEAKDRQTIVPALQNLFISSFSGIFSPLACDEKFLGFFSFESHSLMPHHAMELLHKSAALIKGLFYRWEKGTHHFLPCLPNSFPSGRLLGFGGEGITIDLQWSKGLMHSCTLIAHETSEHTFSFQKEIREFRIRNGKNDRGSVLKNGKSFTLEKDIMYTLDHFKK